MPPISVIEARSFMEGLGGLSDREPVWPALRPVLMGWSWAFYWGQKMLDNLFDEALNGVLSVRPFAGRGADP